MQTFQNTADQKVWLFNDDVVATATSGVYSFTTALGVPLTNAPTTLVPYTIPAPTTAELLTSAQSAQTVLVKSACSKAITAGFSSSALGSAYFYGSNPTDQGNIGYVALRGGSLWCAPASGAWTFTAHTSGQGDQVLADLAAHIQAQQTIYANLLTQINSATEASAVSGIVWPSA